MEGIQTLLIVVAVMGGLFILIPSLAYMYSFKGIKSKTVGDGQHGTARFLSKAEKNQVYKKVKYTPDKWREKQSHPDIPHLPSAQPCEEASLPRKSGWNSLCSLFPPLP